MDKEQAMLIQNTIAKINRELELLANNLNGIIIYINTIMEEEE